MYAGEACRFRAKGPFLHVKAKDGRSKKLLKKSHLCISTKTHDWTNSLSHWVRTWNAAGCKISGVCLPPHRCCEMFLFALTVQCGVCFSSHPLLIHKLRNATVRLSVCLSRGAWARVLRWGKFSRRAVSVHLFFSAICSIPFVRASETHVLFQMWELLSLERATTRQTNV